MNTTANNSFALAAPAAPSIPSIGSSSMLVELSISTWTGRKQDKKATRDAAFASQADTDVVSAHKKLLGDCAELDTVQKFTANCRNLHTGMTMPWSDSGLRLLPTAQYFKYHEAMTDMQDQYYRLVRLFLDQYDWAITRSQAKLGALFNPNEYPSIDKISTKFAFRLNYIPLPEAGDFRIDIGSDATAEVHRHYQNFYATQYRNAMGDVWQRVYKSLSKMSERLDYTDKEDKKIFRDSLVSNVIDMIDLLDVCNITGDSQMAAMKTQLEDALRGVTPEALREDAYLRAETKRHVDEAIKNLPSLDF